MATECRRPPPATAMANGVVSSEHGRRIVCLGGRRLHNTSTLCERAIRLLERHRTAIERAAIDAARALGADWLRLDAFLSEAGSFSVMASRQPCVDLRLPFDGLLMASPALISPGERALVPVAHRRLRRRR